jgi:general secretion pathway protein F
MLTFVVPRFAHVYADIGGDLPLPSRLLLAWGEMIESRGTEVFVVTLVIGTLAAFCATRRATRAWMLDRIAAFPAVRERMHVYQLARFYRTLGMLLRGGMPIVVALDMTGDLLAVSWRGRLARARADIRAGAAISAAMEEHGLTTPVAMRMLRVGERSGRMGEMMERIAAFYDDEIARWIDWFTRLIEPLLMAAIGVLIGTIVVLMYLPIFELAGSLQ